MRYETTPVAALAICALCAFAQGCGDDKAGGPGDEADLAASSADLALGGEADLGAADIAAPAGNPYAAPGPATRTTVTETASLASTEVTLTIVIPSTPGPRPVVVISPGFLQTAAAYVPYAERLASFGIIAISRNDPGTFTNSVGAAEQLTALVATWLPAQAALASSPLFGRVDVAKVGLLGHSRGGQVSLLAAAGDLKGKIVALCGLDPVDSPLAGANARATLGTIGIPTAIFGETLDGTSKFGFGMACAPAADNYEKIYAVAPSPSLLLTVNGADHYDFELASQAIGAGLCQEGTASSTQVLELAVAMSTGFFARELLGEPVGSTLDGAGAAGYVMSGLLTRTVK